MIKPAVQPNPPPNVKVRTEFGMLPPRMAQIMELTSQMLEYKAVEHEAKLKFDEASIAVNAANQAYGDARARMQEYQQWIAQLVAGYYNNDAED